MQQPFARRLTTILAADIVGYSRLTGADEEGTLTRLRALRRELINPAIDGHRGRVVKTTGDGMLIEFTSVVDAVRCAVAVQRGMIARNAALEAERHIEFRVGIHLGDVVVERDGDLMGDGVNIAARLEGIAPAGGICLSLAAFQQIKGKIDLPIRDLGQQRLKNIAEPVQVFCIEPEAGSSAIPLPRAPQRRATRGVVIAAVLAALVLVAGLAWYRLAGPSPASDAASAAGLSIVVLPFANLSGDPAQDHLADIMSDEITTYLSRIPGAFVIARNTAFTYKGKAVDVKQIGRDLGVRYALEGSTQSTSDRVRINVQLIDAESGAHVWADNLDANRADLLEMQDDLVTRLTRSLHIQLASVEAVRVARAHPANLDAEDLAMKCESIFLTYGSNRPETEAGYGFCERALESDPNNVRALVFLAEKHVVDVITGRTKDRQADVRRAEDLVSHALAIDPNHAFAHHVLANVLQMQGRFDESMVEDQRALALDPSEILAYQGLAQTNVFLGQPEKIMGYADTAIRLSPHDPQLYLFYFDKGQAAFMMRQDEEAAGWFRRAVAENPEYPALHAYLAAALGSSGHGAEARDALARYLSLRLTTVRTIVQERAVLSQGASPSPFTQAYREHVLAGLRKAGMPEQ